MKYAAKGAEMNWAPLINQNYWMLPMSGFSSKSAEKVHKKNETDHKDSEKSTDSEELFRIRNSDKFKKGNQVEKTSFNTLSKTLIVDSGSSYIVLPIRDMNTFRKYLWTDFDISTYKYGSLQAFNCTMEKFKSMPDLVIGINGHDITIPRDSYVYKQKDQCVLLL